MNSVIMVSRRGFLKATFSAGALILCSRFLPGEALDALAAAGSWQPGVYLGIEPDGTVIVIAHRSEMGTGIRTSLPMVAADELEADWKRVRVEQALGDPRYGDQNTDGSKSIRDFYDPLRQAGATARLMLERAAAIRWGVPVSECRAQNHQVVHRDGRALGFGELAALAAKQPVPERKELRFKTPAECRLVGRLKSHDDKEARKVKGVVRTVVIEAAQPPYGFQPLGGVAVLATSTWAAQQGRRKLKTTWEPGKNAVYDSEAFRTSLLETVRRPQKVVRSIGDVDAAFAAATKVYEAEYYVPHLAHATMEPPAAVAEYRNGKVTIWAATQNPQAVQDTVAKAVGIAKEDVICHVTLLGGGFGRKSKPDYVAEAAILAKKTGKPVQVTWSREDDISHDYYHTVSAMYLKAATDAKGRPTALLQRCAFPPIPSTFNDAAVYGGDGELAQGWVDVPFDIPNIRAENGPAQAHVRIGWFRAVANIYHAFAVQSFIDELAAAAGRDRIDYFLELLGAPRTIDFAAEGTKNANYGKPLDQYPWETGRLRRVVELVAEKSGWATIKPDKGRALGFAAHRSFLSYIAVVADVRVDDRGRITIPRVDVAVDVGRVIHPERVRAQFEGAAVFGASLALMGEITAAKGRIQQSNFNDYPLARISEAPVETHVHLVPDEGLPTGVGEAGVPPIAPALCNALYAITGKRIRQLPISRTRLV